MEVKENTMLSPVELWMTWWWLWFMRVLQPYLSLSYVSDVLLTSSELVSKEIIWHLGNQLNDLLITNPLKCMREMVLFRSFGCCSYMFQFNVLCGGRTCWQMRKIKRGDQANFSISIVLPQITAGCLPCHLWECTRHLCLEILWKEKHGEFPVMTKRKSLKWIRCQILSIESISSVFQGWNNMTASKRVAQALLWVKCEFNMWESDVVSRVQLNLVT